MNHLQDLFPFLYYMITYINETYYFIEKKYLKNICYPKLHLNFMNHSKKS